MALQKNKKYFINFFGEMIFSIYTILMAREIL